MTITRRSVPSEYLAAVGSDEENTDADDRVAVIVASGSILDGSQPPGTIGGDSTAATIRRAIDDDDVKALVLRVDSGGGSAFASEIIQRELQVFRESDRPVVVSMSSVAASGGYWISMGADEIWASPTTITGSIGVGATFPTFSRSLDRIGVHVDGVGTTRLSGQDNLMRALGNEFSALVQQSIERVYADFIGNIAEYRDKSVDDVDMVCTRSSLGSQATRRHSAWWMNWAIWRMRSLRRPCWQTFRKTNTACSTTASN